MVTGAGGSIGGELCRQIARVRPRKIVLVDHAEDNLFNIRRELDEDRHFGQVEAVLGDCKELPRMQEIFEQFKPDIVFHAAAYKHVQLMQENPGRGDPQQRDRHAHGRRSWPVSPACDASCSCRTDKAVKPQTDDGRQQGAGRVGDRERAGAPRGHHLRQRALRQRARLSSGSVVPIFRRQIAAGGPVTVTHPEMTRYFMTIPEAVQLIIRAGNLGRGGEIFVLEMGEPVKIIDLARNMISLAGLEPDVDIPIVGHRPGARREAARRPLQSRRAAAADTGREDRAGRAPADGSRPRRGDLRRGRAADHRSESRRRWPIWCRPRPVKRTLPRSSLSRLTAS